MLEDRDYMRSPSRGLPWSATKIMSVVLVVAFIFQNAFDAYSRTPIEYWLALTPACFLKGWVWQLITYQFLHGGLLHIAFNLITFWWIGHYVEGVLGKQRFLVAMLGCGVVGGILQGVLMIISPRFGTGALGASAGVAGLFAIFALLERDMQVRLYFILPVRAITLLWAFGIISLFFVLVPSPGMRIANAAHLGGLLAGIAWVKLGWHHDYVRLPWEGFFERWSHSRSFGPRRRRREMVRTPSTRTPPWSRRPQREDPTELPSEEFISKEVDPILDKISAHGIQSLTERERKILEAARNKMAKR